MNWKKLSTATIAILLITVIISVIVGLYVYATYLAGPTTVPTNGTVPPIAAIISVDPPVINWGTLARGTNNTQLVTLTNDSQNVTDRIINIQLSTDDWQNTTDTGLVLTWDYAGTDIYPTQSFDVIFTLSVASNAPAQTIDFDIVLTPEIG